HAVRCGHFAVSRYQLPDYERCVERHLSVRASGTRRGRHLHFRFLVMGQQWCRNIPRSAQSVSTGELSLTRIAEPSLDINRNVVDVIPILRLSDRLLPSRVARWT